jgi:hypothetical protein
MRNESQAVLGSMPGQVSLTVKNLTEEVVPRDGLSTPKKKRIKSKG